MFYFVFIDLNPYGTGIIYYETCSVRWMAERSLRLGPA